MCMKKCLKFIIKSTYHKPILPFLLKLKELLINGFVPGQAWAAATTEGLLIYSLDTGVVFDPFQLEQSITPDSIRKTLQEEDWAKGRL